MPKRTKPHVRKHTKLTDRVLHQHLGVRTAMGKTVMEELGIPQVLP